MSNFFSSGVAQVPCFYFRGANCFGLPPKFTPENGAWLLRQLAPRARVVFIGLQPTSVVCDLVRALVQSGRTVVQFLYTGEFDKEHVTRIAEACACTRIGPWGKHGSVVEWMEREPRLLGDQCDVILFHNSPRGYLYALGRLGLHYESMTRDVEKLTARSNQYLSETAQILEDMWLFGAPAYSYYPAKQVQAQAGIYSRFAIALARNDFSALGEEARIMRAIATENATVLIEATCVENCLAFADMEPYFQTRRPVNIEHWQNELMRLRGPVLFCSTGGGRTYVHDQLEPIVIVQTPRQWHGLVDLVDIVKGHIPGLHRPDYLRLARSEFERFRILWEQKMPPAVRDPNLLPQRPSPPPPRAPVTGQRRKIIRRT